MCPLIFCCDLCLQNPCYWLSIVVVRVPSPFCDPSILDHISLNLHPILKFDTDPRLKESHATYLPRQIFVGAFTCKIHFLDSALSKSEPEINLWQHYGLYRTQSWSNFSTITVDHIILEKSLLMQIAHHRWKVKRKYMKNVHQGNGAILCYNAWKYQPKCFGSGHSKLLGAHDSVIDFENSSSLFNRSCVFETSKLHYLFRRRLFKKTSIQLSTFAKGPSPKKSWFDFDTQFDATSYFLSEVAIEVPRFLSNFFVWDYKSECGCIVCIDNVPATLHHAWRSTAKYRPILGKGWVALHPILPFDQTPVNTPDLAESLRA